MGCEVSLSAIDSTLASMEIEYDAKKEFLIDYFDQSIVVGGGIVFHEYTFCMTLFNEDTMTERIIHNMQYYTYHFLQRRDLYTLFLLIVWTYSIVGDCCSGYYREEIVQRHFDLCLAHMANIGCKLYSFDPQYPSWHNHKQNEVSSLNILVETTTPPMIYDDFK